MRLAALFILNWANQGFMLEYMIPVFLSTVILTLVYFCYKQRQRANDLLDKKNDELFKLFNYKGRCADLENQLVKVNRELKIYQDRLAELVDERTKELLQAKEEAEKNNRIKTAFFENTSHEIRTPMNTILGFINLLSDSTNSQETRDYYLRIVNESGKNLLRVIEDIIDFSLIQTGEFRLSKSNIEVIGLIKQRVLIYRQKVARENREVNILMELPNKQMEICLDRNKFIRLIDILVENAVKYTEKGYVKLGIEKIEEKNITFFVEDTGIGIDSKKLNILFDRFFVVEEENPAKLLPGTDLSLALAQKLTHIMGGKIWVESETNQGAKFFFTVPNEVKQTYKSEECENKMQNISWRGKNILIAEDDEANFILLKTVFAKTGAEIFHAKDGVELLELLSANTDIDLIIMDIKMPRMSGLNALKIIKENYKDIPVIAQTAFDQAFHKEKCLELGCTDFLTKPLKIEKLLITVSKHLIS